MSTLDINKASKKELESLPGIGPKTAAEIIKYRKKHGPFLLPSHIKNVNGISDKTYSRIKAKIESNVFSDQAAMGEKILKSAGNFIGTAIKKSATAWLNNDSKSKKKASTGKKRSKTGTIRKFKKFGSKVKYADQSDSTDNRSSAIGKNLTSHQIIQAADELNIESAALRAVIDVESAGRGFLKNGQPKILFEGHIFWNQLIAIGKQPRQLQRNNENILYPKWTKKYYKGGMDEHKRLEKAIDIHKAAALKSASWGMFQVMGFNYHYSHPNINAFIEDMNISEEKHLEIFIAFIKKKRLIRALKSKDWKTFARTYNGAGYKKNRYDDKLESAYIKYRRQYT